VPGPEGGHGAGPGRGQHGPVDDAQRHAGVRVEQQHQGELAGQAEAPVADEVADHLDPADVLGPEVAAEHVEMPGAPVGGRQVDTRLEHDLAFALGPDGALDRGQDLGPRDVEGADVRPGDEAQV
jgi:hypothetical protein